MLTLDAYLSILYLNDGIPFELKLEVPNDRTAAAIENGRKIMKDPSAPRYSSMESRRYD